MTFSEFEIPMAIGLTLRTIEWARSHDWFRGVTVDGRGVIVEDRSWHRTFGEQVEIREFRNRAALREFAGY